MRRLLLALALFSAGCSVAPERPVAPDAEQAWALHRASLDGLRQWHLTGRIAIQSDGQAWQATLDCSQQRARYTINIIGPLGSGSMRLEGDEAHAVLQSDDGESVSAMDPELLLLRQTGWRVPVRALRYWVLGLPAPGP